MQKQKKTKTKKIKNLLGSIDLRYMTELSETRTEEKPNNFVIRTPNRTYYLEAPNEEERSKWISQIKNTRVFNVPIEIVAKRKQGSHDKGVPLIVVKCIAYLNFAALLVTELYVRPVDANQLLKLKQSFDQVFFFFFFWDGGC